MRREIRRVKALTSRPFAVQFPAKPMAHVYAAQLPREHVDFIAGLAAEFNVPLPEHLPKPEDEWWGAPSTAQQHQELLEVILDEQVPVLVTFYGNPGGIVEQAHQRGTRVMSLVGTTKHAERCIESGADVLIATGYDAGGHEDDVGTMALVPQVVDVAQRMGRSTTVMAAGGIMDGHGLVAALALGAVGISCGTAFLASPECRPFLGFIPFTKDEEPEPWYRDFMLGQLLNATEDGTSQQPVYSGGPMRALDNAYKQAWARPSRCRRACSPSSCGSCCAAPMRRAAPSCWPMPPGRAWACCTSSGPPPTWCG